MSEREKTKEQEDAKSIVRPGRNQGHGHVFPRPDGVKARCGGPNICSVCRDDLIAYKKWAGETPPPRLQSDLIASLSCPAKDGGFENCPLSVKCFETGCVVERLKVTPEPSARDGGEA